MNPLVMDAARAFCERAQRAGQVGKSEDLQELLKLNQEMQGRLPDWLLELCVSLPLRGLELNWEAEDSGGVLEWAGVTGIRSESLECYPGIAILQHGYVNIGSDPVGSGDSFFIPTDVGDDPPVYQVYHDVSDQAEEILREGRLQVSTSLSSLFDSATGSS